MFQEANAIASRFTFPVILSRMDFMNRCSSSIGAFVVVNKDGWIVTAGHILEQWVKMVNASQVAGIHDEKRLAIEADRSLDRKTKQAKLRDLGKPNKDDTKHASALWGGFSDFPQLTNIAYLPSIDLGIGKLEPFDPAWVSDYPVFKDPSKEFGTGVSLCKLGFPFHGFEPQCNEEARSFVLPENAIPIPFFPIEGIFTRTIMHEAAENGNPMPFPMWWVETSAPGLRGQSGGPTFDSKGFVWAIQCRTASYPLGFSEKNPAECLHVGLGVHPVTIFEFFKKYGVTYQVSN